MGENFTKFFINILDGMAQWVRLDKFFINTLDGMAQWVRLVTNFS